MRMVHPQDGPLPLVGVDASPTMLTQARRKLARHGSRRPRAGASTDPGLAGGSGPASVDRIALVTSSTPWMTASASGPPVFAHFGRTERSSSQQRPAPAVADRQGEPAPRTLVTPLLSPPDRRRLRRCLHQRSRPTGPLLVRRRARSAPGSHARQAATPAARPGSMAATTASTPSSKSPTHVLTTVGTPYEPGTDRPRRTNGANPASASLTSRRRHVRRSGSSA